MTRPTATAMGIPSGDSSIGAAERRSYNHSLLGVWFHQPYAKAICNKYVVIKCLYILFSIFILIHLVTSSCIRCSSDLVCHVFCLFCFVDWGCHELVMVIAEVVFKHSKHNYNQWQCTERELLLIFRSYHYFFSFLFFVTGNVSDKVVTLLLFLRTK